MGGSQYWTVSNISACAFQTGLYWHVLEKLESAQTWAEVHISWPVPLITGLYWPVLKNWIVLEIGR